MKKRMALAFALVAAAFSPVNAASAADGRAPTWRQAVDHNMAILKAGIAPTAANVSMAAAPVGPTTWSANIAGNVMHNGAEKAVHPLIYAIASSSELPLSIGVQEACAGQALILLAWLQQNKSEHYRMNFRKQNKCANGQDYGIAVYAIGDTGRSSGTFASQRAGDEVRGWACIRSVYGYHACTAHMTPKGDNGTIQTSQFKEMHDVVTWIGTANNSVMFWGGDFYMTPGGIQNARGADFFTKNPEGDLCKGGYRITVDNGLGRRKVDYVFRTKPVACTQDAVVHLDLGYSDHALVGGYL